MEWAKILNIDENTLRSRYYSGKIRGEKLFLPKENMIRSNALIIEYNGIKKPLKEWVRNDLSFDLLYQRYHKGWRGEKLLAPVTKSKSHSKKQNTLQNKETMI